MLRSHKDINYDLSRKENYDKKIVGPRDSNDDRSDSLNHNSDSYQDQQNNHADQQNPEHDNYDEDYNSSN